MMAIPRRSRNSPRRVARSVLSLLVEVVPPVHQEDVAGTPAGAEADVEGTTSRDRRGTDLVN
jgi:hypothetical protein